MAEGKKSFTAYCNWSDTFEELSDEEAGKLVKHLFRYVTDKNPEPPDRLTKIAFIEIKNTLKRDLKKWENKVEANRLNGLKGGRPKKASKTQNNPTVILDNPTKPKKGDNDNDNDNDTAMVTVKENVKVTLKDRMVDFQKKISPLISENFTREDANDFYRYWTEMNEGGYKMRFEKEKTWNIKSRIVTWVKNKKVARKNKDDGRISAKDYFNNLRNGTGLPQNENKFIE